jgi:hypothetical protein
VYESFSVARLPEAMTPPGPPLRRRLERFVHIVRGLTQSPLFKSSVLALRCTPTGDGLFDVECVAPVDEFGMRRLLTYFRQLWQPGESPRNSVASTASYAASSSRGISSRPSVARGLHSTKVGPSRVTRKSKEIWLV